MSTPEERFYYADDKKVPLVPSSHYVAVRAEARDREEVGRAAARVAESLSTMTTPARVFDLSEYGLAVIAVPEGAARADATARSPQALMRAMMEDQADLAEGPPVYETPEGAAGEGLIPIGEILVRFKPEVAEDAQRRLLDKYKLEVRRADYPAPGSCLVAIANGQDTIEVANRLHEDERVEHAEPNFVHIMPRLVDVKDSLGPGTATMEAPLLRGGDMPSAQPRLELPTEERGGPTVEAAPAAPPTDPAFASQWGLQKIRAPEAFDITMGRPDISVAVIDEGCDLSHEDLSYKLPGYDAYDGDDDPTPNGNDAHGTACAGIATALANNGKGGAGVAPQCKTMPIRIAQGIGGGFWDTTSAKVADGIRKAVDRGADVLSNSYSVAPSTEVTNAFKYAQTNGRGGKGCPIAAATGNGDILGVIYPARLSPTIPGFLAVGASNQWDQRKSKTSLDGEFWWGSNFGPEVDVVAPGVKIYTTDIMGSAGYGGGNYVPDFNGTSSATPHVAGLMALILSVDPDLRSWEVEDIVKLTAVDLGPAGRDDEFGFGRIDCRRALEAASRLWYEVQVVPVFLGRGRECFMRMNVRMYNSGINSVRLDALTVTSHNHDWTAEIDRLEYRPNPGGIMAPRAGHDLRLNHILLRANGSLLSWSYRWALSWSYTFWRPSAPGFPLSADGAPLSEVSGTRSMNQQIRGGSEGSHGGLAPTAEGMEASLLASATPGPQLAALSGNGHGLGLGNGAAATGDSITIDRQSRSITIHIRG